MLTTRTTTTALAIVALTGSLALGAGLAGLGGSAAVRAQPATTAAMAPGPGLPAHGPGGGNCWGPTVGTPDAVQNRSGAQA